MLAIYVRLLHKVFHCLKARVRARGLKIKYCIGNCSGSVEKESVYILLSLINKRSIKQTEIILL